MKVLVSGTVLTLALVASCFSYPHVPQDLANQPEEGSNGSPYDWGLNVYFFKDGEVRENDFQEDERLPRVEIGPVNLFPNSKSSKKCSSNKQCKTEEYCSKYKTCINRIFPNTKLYENGFPSESQFGQRYADSFL